MVGIENQAAIPRSDTNALGENEYIDLSKEANNPAEHDEEEETFEDATASHD